MVTMMNIKETVKDPYTALELMCDGLLRQSRRKNFKVNMNTYGQFALGICYGCAASSTIQELAKKNFKGKEINEDSRRADYLGFAVSELDAFETCIDDVRGGFLFGIFKFFDMEDNFDQEFDNQWFLSTKSWKQELPKIRKFIKNGRKS